MKKVLIIEDDPVVANIYHHKLLAAGYAVQVARDGETGLEKLKEFQPDLVQLDLMLPKLNGVEVIKEIRSKPELQSLLILVLSGGYAPDLVTKAWEAGANQCLSKLNSSPKIVVDAISQMLGSTASPATASPAPTADPAVSPTPAPPPPQPVAAASTTSPPTSGADTVPPSGAYTEFLKQAPKIQTQLRERLHALVRGENDQNRVPVIIELQATIHSLAGFSGVTGLNRLAHLASAVEVLLNELHNKPTNITRSTLHTIARAVDCLLLLCEQDRRPQDELPPSALILVVDDDPVSCKTLRTALGKAHLKAVTLGDPELALKVLAENRFDLVFSDVNMPGMNGYDFCKALRAQPTNKTTPVVFVTSASDLESRAQSTISGGNDFIIKPFPMIEMAVKALTFIVQPKVNAAPAPAPAPVSGAAPAVAVAA